MATMKVELSSEDLQVICNGLVLARASALRLSNRAGISPDVIAVYRKEYDRVNAVLTRVQHFASVK